MVDGYWRAHSAPGCLRRFRALRLGLNRVRVIVKANGGEMYAKYDPNVSALVTTLTMPAHRMNESA